MKTSELTGKSLDWAVSLAVGELTAHLKWYHRRYSTDWSLAGPIIERWKIDVGTYRNAWRAARHVGDAPTYGYGDTPLIAAMRCFVASKLGDEVDVPEELT